MKYLQSKNDITSYPDAFHSASGRNQTTSVDQMNWPDSPSSVRSVIWPSIHFQLEILFEWSLLQLILGLLLSYLVQDLTSVHHI